MSAPARLTAWARLGLVHGLDARAMHALLTRWPAPEQVLEASASALAAAVGPALAGRIAAGPPPELLERTLAWAAGEGHHLLAWDDADYPRGLLDLADAPVLLYCIGRRELLGRPAIAIVGSRNATPIGEETAELFGGALADAGLTVASGLALGIDAAAHRGGLGGAAGSLAVMGTGADRIYPARNRPLALRLAREGALLTEMPLGTVALARNFPRRNRLIAALSRGVLVVEAALGSGSLGTARIAGELGREVFAIPGSIHSPFSKGCHRLIREGAKLVESAQDVLEELGLAGAQQARARAGARRGAHGSAGAHVANSGPASAAARKVLKALGYEAQGLDSIVERAGMPAAQVQAALTELELDARVAHLPGGAWQRRG